jgi:hypothetical protein
MPSRYPRNTISTARAAGPRPVVTTGRPRELLRPDRGGLPRGRPHRGRPGRERDPTRHRARPTTHLQRPGGPERRCRCRAPARRGALPSVRAAVARPGGAPRCRRRPCSPRSRREPGPHRHRGCARSHGRGGRPTGAHRHADHAAPRPRNRQRAADGGQEGARRRATSARSGRELAAALVAPRREDGAAGTRTHAQPEAVLLGATAVVRLVGALAHDQAPTGQCSRRRRGHAGVACNNDAGLAG